MEYTDRTRIIVMELHANAGNIMMGIVVDAVSEVLNVKAADIEETPSFGTAMNNEQIPA